jgi:hypothetical protein
MREGERAGIGDGGLGMRDWGMGDVGFDDEGMGCV